MQSEIYFPYEGTYTITALNLLFFWGILRFDGANFTSSSYHLGFWALHRLRHNISLRDF